MVERDFNRSVAGSLQQLAASFTGAGTAPSGCVTIDTDLDISNAADSIAVRYGDKMYVTRHI